MKNKIITICTIAGALFVMMSGIALAVETKLLTPIPGAEQAITEVSGVAEYLVGIYKFGLATVGILAMGGIMVGGFLYITGSYSGKVGQTANGKDIIISSLTGLAIGLFSWLLINTIDPNLTKMRDVFLNTPAPSASEQSLNDKAVDNCNGQCTNTCSSKGEAVKMAFVEHGICSCDCVGSADTCNKIICGEGVPLGMKEGDPVYDEANKSCDCKYTPIKDDPDGMTQILCNTQCQERLTGLCGEGNVAPGMFTLPNNCACKCKDVENNSVATEADSENEEEDSNEGLSQLPDTDSEDEEQSCQNSCSTFSCNASEISVGKLDVTGKCQCSCEVLKLEF